MKASRFRLLFATIVGRLFLTLWLGIAALTAGRFAFDIITYIYGNTLVFRDKSNDYLLRLPCGYHDFDPPRPLLIFLHGASELDKDVRFLKKADVVHFAGGKIAATDFPFIVVSPKSSPYGWKADDVVVLLDELLRDDGSRIKIDPKRIYLTGFSMGGYGVWETAQRYSDRFAAVVPLAGGCRSFQPELFEHLPIWAFHGELDDIVPVTETKEPVESLRRYRRGAAETRLTLYPDLGHDIAPPTYRDVDLYRWLLRHEIAR